MPLRQSTLSLLGLGGTAGMADQYESQPDAARSFSSSGALSPSTMDMLGIGPKAAPPPPPDTTSHLSALEMLTYPLTLPKRGIDWLAREGAQAMGLNVPDTMTVGQMARTAAGLEPERGQGFGERLGGKALEFGADVALDPLTWALGGAGKVAGAGREAAAFVGPRLAEEAAQAAKAIEAGKTAENIGRGAAAAFAPTMALGAYQEGSEALRKAQEQGFTPETAESAFGAGLGGLAALASGTHALRGGPEATVTPVVDEAVPKALSDSGMAPAEPVIQPSSEFRPGAASSSWRPLVPFDEYMRRTPQEVQADMAAANQPPASAALPDVWTGDQPRTPGEVAEDLSNQKLADAIDAQTEAATSRGGPPRLAGQPWPVSFSPQAVEAMSPEAQSQTLPGVTLEELQAREAASQTQPAMLRPEPPPPDFHAWVRAKFGELPADANTYRGYRDAYLKEFQNADSEQFRPGQGLGERSTPAVPEPTPYLNAAATDEARTAATSDAHAKVPDSEVEAELPVLAETLRKTDLRLAPPGFLEQSGLDGYRKQDVIKAIEIDGDNPTYLDVKEKYRQAMASVRGNEDISFDPAELERQAVSEPTQPDTYRQSVQQKASALADLGWGPEQLQHMTMDRLDSIIANKEAPPYPRAGERAMATNLGGTAKPASMLPLEERQAAAKAQGIPEDHPFFPREEVVPGADAARIRLAKRAEKLGKGSASLGVDPGMFKDYAHVGADFIARGARDFAQWSARMIGEFGDAIKEHLGRLWEDAKRTAGEFGYTFLGMGEQAPEARPSEAGVLNLGGKKPVKPIPPGAKPGQTAAPTAPTPTAAPAPTAIAPKAAVPPNQGFWAMLREGWKSGLVSAPGTQAANTISNVGERGVRIGESAVAGVVDKLLGGQRTRFSGEALEQIKGAVGRSREAAGVLSDGLRNVANSQGAIPGRAGGIARVPLELLKVNDAASAEMSRGAELQSLAYREAKQKLPNGTSADVAALRDRIMANPSQEMLDRVERNVKQSHFQEKNDPDSLIGMLAKLRNKHKWLHVPLPFLETPGNIAKLAIQRSPAGFVKAYKAFREYKQAMSTGSPLDKVAMLKGEAVDAITRPLVGTTMLGLFGTYAKMGGMTGSGPTDPKEKGLLKETGWQPYSFVFTGADGKKAFVPFNRFEPVSSLLGFAADMAEMKDQKKSGDLFDKALGSIMENLSSKTYLQGLADAAEFVNDPKRFAGTYASNLASSGVPNIVAKIAQSIDPKMRETKPDTPGLLGIQQRIARSVESRIPGLSETLPARRTATGEEIERPGNALTRLLSPVQPSKEKAGKDLEGLLVNIGYVPSQPAREVTLNGKKIPVGEKDYAKLQQANEFAADYVRKNLLQSDTFMRLPDTIAEGGKFSKEAMIRRIYDKFRDRQRHLVYSSSDFKQAYRDASRS